MKSLSPCEISYIATAIANELARGKTIEEIHLLKFIVSQVSATLSTIACQKAYDDKHKPPKC